MASTAQATSARALLEALAAEGPDPEHAEELMLYGQFVGEWEFDWTGYGEDGEPTLSERGEWIFAWALEGRAVLDVWIIPERGRRGRPDVPEGEYGTTIRFYDPRANDWKVTWNGPIAGARRTFVARGSGDEIVQEGETEDGHPMRWIFSAITPDSFHWRSLYSKDGERTWQLREEMDVRRRAPG
jgi:hypothetical protein